MSFFADIHIHSKYSRATSRDCDLDHISLWAKKKGIGVVGTGDFTHPAWRAELADKLVPDGSGLYALEGSDVRFMLTVEISTIYKKGDRTRKVHHVIVVPTLEVADRVAAELARIGNVTSDGRPILGLDSRDLLEIVLESDPGSYLIPAHIWTPWFSALGSKSGFDSIEECYGDLAPHIFAVETGLSSDPPMNWMVSSLDKYRLVSNSDAHSPQKLGREACIFDTEVDYASMRRALETGAGYVGTVEFFPEEGKYHLDGHRKCNMRLDPKQTREEKGVCPVCGKPVTVGVKHRVEELADRGDGSHPKTAGKVVSLIPLPEILSEIYGVGASSKAVTAAYEALICKLGPELTILTSTPVEDIRGRGSTALAEAISRLRRGEVIRQAGYDGEYGVIRLFDEGELTGKDKLGLLFDLPPIERKGRRPRKVAAETRPCDAKEKGAPSSVGSQGSSSSGLDPEQRRAAGTTDGALLIVAGPGSGKTRTLAHRIASLVQGAGADPAECLAIAFTRRAAGELKARLKALLPDVWERVSVHTFHSFALSVLSEDGGRIGLSPDFRVVDDVSFDELIQMAMKLLSECGQVRDKWRGRCRCISIDEYQDIDEAQYSLVRLIAPEGANICAIGDPDQAIYGFRGADVRFFRRFTEDYPDAKVVSLKRNYRSIKAIVDASMQIVSPLHDVEKDVEALVSDPGRIVIHEAPSEKAEAEFVVSAIEKLLGGHTFFSIDSGRGGDEDHCALAFSDIAVLYRTKAQAASLCEAFDRSGMPFQRRGHERLIDSPGVARLVEIMRGRRFEGSVAAALADCAEGADCDDPAEVSQAAEMLRPIAKRCGHDLALFLNEVTMGDEIDTLNPKAERISLLTMHAAKGLEFKVVFMVGCEDGILPLRWGGKEAANPDEERRLFYVGMTRAMQKLFLCRARRRLWRGKVREMDPSPFLTDIEERLIRFQQSAFKRKRRSRAEQFDLF